MQTELKDIHGYENLYKITKNGQIWSVRRKIWLKTFIDRLGYVRITLCKDGSIKSARVHRLVAQTYLPNPNNYPEVNHIDKNRSNNEHTNLEWCTREENVSHQFDKPTRKQRMAALKEAGIPDDLITYAFS